MTTSLDLVPAPAAPCAGCPLCGSIMVAGPTYEPSAIGGCVEDRLWYQCQSCFTEWRVGPDDRTPEYREEGEAA